MKIRPIVLCGGAGTRLWPDQKNHQAKQFINFGGWTLISKTLDRIKNPIFEPQNHDKNYFQSRFCRPMSHDYQINIGDR